MAADTCRRKSYDWNKTDWILLLARRLYYPCLTWQDKCIQNLEPARAFDVIGAPCTLLNSTPDTVYGVDAPDQLLHVCVFLGYKPLRGGCSQGSNKGRPPKVSTCRIFDTTIGYCSISIEEPMYG
eukprot:3971338-Amphidinium_carterae.1